MTLTYRTGDVTDPQLTPDQFDHPVIIPHVVNDKGAMGAGVAKALYTKWPAVKSDYLDHANYGGLLLGRVIKTVAIPDFVYVHSMVGQSDPGVTKSQEVWTVNDGHHDVDYRRRPPIRYGHLALCMWDVGRWTRECNGSIHAPRFGSDLAAGDWSVIESLILELWVDQGINVTIYDYSRG